MFQYDVSADFAQPFEENIVTCRDGEKKKYKRELEKCN